MQFAYITGWRAKSAVITLEWRQVDFRAEDIRLEPGTTKNKAGRTFPFTSELRTLLEAQHVEHERLKKQGVVVPWECRGCSIGWSLVELHTVGDSLCFGSREVASNNRRIADRRPDDWCHHHTAINKNGHWPTHVHGGRLPHTVRT